MTSAEGKFRLDAVDPGAYRVTAQARGYGAGEIYPVVVREDEPDPEIELNIERGTICGAPAWITRLGFGRHAMDRVANHKTRSVTDVYDRHGYAEEDRRISTSWGSSRRGQFE